MLDRPDRIGAAVTGKDHLAGRVIIVTGAGSGFGRLVSAKAAARGANIIGSDVNEDGLAETVTSITTEGGSAIGVPADVADLDAMMQVVAAAVDTFGHVDAIVNNAGVMPLAFFADHEQAADAWHRCIDINIKGVLNGMIAVHDQMIEQGRGHVINLSSIYGNYPTGGAAVYGASKAAVDMMSGAFRLESQGKIKVTVIKPTGVPGTGLGSGVINPAAVAGILGANTEAYFAELGAVMSGTADPALSDADNVQYAVLDPEHIADAIIHALDQPWGVSISDITVRATGDRYIL